MRIALAQINPTIGDLAGNISLMEDSLRAAEQRGADLVVFPELSVCGYPPRDFIERPSFLEAATDALHGFVGRVGRRRPDGGQTAAVVGFPERLPGTGSGRGVANSAALIDDGRIVSVHRKTLLPNYDVFDERRYFDPAQEIRCAEWRGRKLAITVCEDIWNDSSFWPRPLYAEDPIQRLVAQGAEIIVNLSASPFTLKKRQLRPSMLASTARRWQRPLVFVNQTGGQDELLFDGSSMAVDGRGRVIAQAAEHVSDLVLVDLASGRGDCREMLATDARSALEGLIQGTRDYVRRCGFKGALLGLSGGIDSAVVACVAARALGPANVLALGMPSRYSAERSLQDAQTLAARLGLAFRTMPIEPVFETCLQTLAPAFVGHAADTTEENLQARIRGNLLMALSNKLGLLLLSTGNKSEVATGYCTLYGDMCGGLAVISDVPKTLVYELAREINRSGEIIPASTMERPPSAELRPDQVDQDSLPPYDVLDAILEQHVEHGRDAAELVAEGFDPVIVEDVLRRVGRAEYKRRQMAPGLKITGKAFGSGRRYPIAHGFRG